MNVLVLGAGGKTGDLVVARALAAGHTVTAFVHDHISPQPAGVRKIVGDVECPETVADAIVGQDAVVDAIGGKRRTRPLEWKAKRRAMWSMQCARTEPNAWSSSP